MNEELYNKITLWIDRMVIIFACNLTGFTTMFLSNFSALGITIAILWSFIGFHIVSRYVK